MLAVYAVQGTKIPLDSTRQKAHVSIAFATTTSAAEYLQSEAENVRGQKFEVYITNIGQKGGRGLQVVCPALKTFQDRLKAEADPVIAKSLMFHPLHMTLSDTMYHETLPHKHANITWSMVLRKGIGILSRAERQKDKARQSAAASAVRQFLCDLEFTRELETGESSTILRIIVGPAGYICCNTMIDDEEKQLFYPKCFCCDPDIEYEIPLPKKKKTKRKKIPSCVALCYGVLRCVVLRCVVLCCVALHWVYVALLRCVVLRC
jgi:hypothetical protein